MTVCASCHETHRPPHQPRKRADLMPVIHPKSTTGKGQLWLQIEVTPS